MVWYYSRMSHFTLFHRYSSCTIKEENYTMIDPMTPERTLNDNLQTSEVIFTWKWCCYQYNHTYIWRESWSWAWSNITQPVIRLWVLPWILECNCIKWKATSVTCYLLWYCERVWYHPSTVPKAEINLLSNHHTSQVGAVTPWPPS